MADLTGPAQIFDLDTTTVDTAQKYKLGTRGRDVDGNEYIYMQGVGSVVLGSVVTYDEDHVTTLIAANAVGRVAVAMAAIDATTKYGWFQIYGKNENTSCDTVAADAGAYIDGTAGRIDDAAVAGDWVSGMIIRSTDTSNLCTTELNYPEVTNGAYLT